MRSSNLLLAGAAILAAVNATAWADTWCNSNGPGAIFCDSFDRYCTSPPADPTLACGTDGTADNDAMRVVWVPAYTDCALGTSMLKLSSDYNSQPYAARYPQQWDSVYNTGGDLAYNKVGLGNLVRGTTGSNLVLDYVLDTEGSGKQNFDHAFMELSLDNAHAPTDYILTTNCHELCPGPEYGPDLQYRMICQQNTPPAGCPPLFTTPRAAVAVGFLATLDNNPCHCENTSLQKPQNYHLAFFDGLKWWTLKSGMFTGGGTISPDLIAGDSVPTPGDFSTATKHYQTMKLTFDGTNCRVDMETKYKASKSGESGTNYTITSYATIPLQYTGPFNSLNYGVPKGCLLSSTAYECATAGSETCLQATPGSGGHMLDNVYLHGGEIIEQQGACCVDNALAPCQDVSQSECQALNGRWAGYATSCSTHTCCPVPFADADYDGDVDQDDFGAFQVCYTGPAGGVPTGCTCFNRVADDTIDGLDLNAFLNCFTGANVPWSASITPSCLP